jgi:predicted RNA-binding Zn-ribbon protein involved in translation (DUF1610 family)
MAVLPLLRLLISSAHLMVWKCPSCGSPVRYEDYNVILSGVRFNCHRCGRSLAVDTTMERIILARPEDAKSPPKPFRKTTR